MATQTPASHQTPVSDEPIEVETVSQINGSGGEEKPNSKELPSVADAEDEQTEPAVVVDKKIDDVSTSEPVSDSANSQITAKPAERPVEEAVEKVEEEKPTVVDAPQSSDEAVVKPQEEPPALLPVKESEDTVQNDHDNTVIAEEVDRPESIVPGVEEHAQQQSEVADDKPEKIESEQLAGEAKDPPETVSLKSEEQVPEVELKQEEEGKFEEAEDRSLEATEKVHDPVAQPKQAETPQLVVPETEVKQEEPELGEPGEQPPEATEKVDEPVVVLASFESKQNINDTVAGAEVKEEEEVKFEKTEEPSSETPQNVIPETEVKQEEDTKLEKPGEQPLEATEKVDDPVVVVASDESKAAAVQDAESLTKQVEAPLLVIPEAEVKQEEEPKFEKPEEQSFEATEKVPDPVVVPATIEPTGALQDADDTVAPAKQLETPQLVVPEAEKQPEDKTVEHSVIAQEVEEPESAIPLVQVKPEEQSGIVEQVETKLNDENPEPIKVTEAMDQGTVRETVKEVTTLVGGTVADTESANVENIDAEEKTSASLNSEQAVSTEQEDQADFKQVQGDITDKAVDVVEVSSKEAIEEKGDAGEEQESKFTETKEENLEKHTPKEEVAQPINVEEVKDSVSNVEVTGRSSEVAKSDGVEPPVEDKTETIKKLDEATKEVTETTKETQDLVSDVKTTESAPAVENEEKKEKAEENNKDGEEQAREAPVKPTQKQSNNIFTKVKQSLVKAKKAITGKSPNPKTVSSDTKDDIKVK